VVKIRKILSILLVVLSFYFQGKAALLPDPEENFNSVFHVNEVLKQLDLIDIFKLTSSCRFLRNLLPYILSQKVALELPDAVNFEDFKKIIEFMQRQQGKDCSPLFLDAKIAVGRQCLNYQDYDIAFEGWRIFFSLIIRSKQYPSELLNVIIEEAIQIIQQNICPPYEYIQIFVLDFLLDLVRNLQCYTFEHCIIIIGLVIQASRQTTKMSDLVQIQINCLFMNLLNQQLKHYPDKIRSEIFRQAIQEAKNNINHPNYLIKARALNLVWTLLKKIIHCPGEQLKYEVVALANQAVRINSNDQLRKINKTISKLYQRMVLYST